MFYIEPCLRWAKQLKGRSGINFAIHLLDLTIKLNLVDCLISVETETENVQFHNL